MDSITVQNFHEPQTFTKNLQLLQKRRFTGPSGVIFCTNLTYLYVLKILKTCGFLVLGKNGEFCVHVINESNTTFKVF